MKPDLSWPFKLIYHAGIAFMILWLVAAYVVFWTLAWVFGIQRSAES